MGLKRIEVEKFTNQTVEIPGWFYELLGEPLRWPHYWTGPEKLEEPFKWAFYEMGHRAIWCDEEMYFMYEIKWGNVPSRPFEIYPVKFNE